MTRAGCFTAATVADGRSAGVECFRIRQRFGYLDTDNGNDSLRRYLPDGVPELLGRFDQDGDLLTEVAALLAFCAPSPTSPALCGCGMFLTIAVIASIVLPLQGDGTLTRG